MLMVLCKLENDSLLNGIRVLILIHQNKLKTLGILLPDVFMFTEKRESHGEQIVEIHGIALLATVLVVKEYLWHGRHLLKDVPFHQFTVLGIFMGKNEVIFGHGYTVVNRRGLIDFLIKIHFLDDSLHK